MIAEVCLRGMGRRCCEPKHDRLGSKESPVEPGIKRQTSTTSAIAGCARAARDRRSSHHGIAMGDIDIELVECFAAEVFEVLLYLHLDIVARKIAVQQIAVAAEFVGNV